MPDQNGKQTKVYDRSYTYDRIAVDSGNRMGTRLASTGYTFGSSSRSFTYTYDKAGNITKIVTAGTSVPKAAESKEYGYDAQGQLVSEKNSSKTTFLYAYDTAGNIRSITKDGTVTKSFGYTNPSWPDLLTSVTANGTTKDVLYEGQSQTSDVPSSGNPVTYYNGKDYTFTWTKGRQLASATVDGKQVSYTYDMSGVRSGKQVYTTSNQRTTTYTYTTLSGKVMRQQWETRLYYLQSRYYDFANCRFINADTFATTDANGFLSANMFAYCENNPVGNSDPNGEFLNTFIGAATGAALGAALALVTGENVKAAAISGAISGAVSGFAADVIIATGGSALVVAGVYGVAGALGSFAGSVAAQRSEGKQVNYGEAFAEGLFGAAFGSVGGLMTGSVTPMMKQVQQTAGKKVVARGITKSYAVRRTIRNEARNSGRTIVENLLSGFTSWYTQFRSKRLFRR